MVPAVTDEDPRYYTPRHGGFFKRTGYAVSRLLLTRTDSGHGTINLSEIVGTGAGAGYIGLILPVERADVDENGPKMGDANRVRRRFQHRERVLA
jgi:hypothetical protein